MSFIRSKMRRWSALNNPKSVYYLITNDGVNQILWAFMPGAGGGGSLTKKAVLVKDYTMYPSVWPNMVSVSSAEGALDRSILLTEQAKGMSTNAFSGGFTQRMGRLSGGTRQALGDVRNEASLYELLAYLIDSLQSVGMVDPPLRLGRWGVKIEYVPEERAERMQRRAIKKRTARHW